MFHAHPEFAIHISEARLLIDHNLSFRVFLSTVLSFLCRGVSFFHDMTHLCQFRIRVQFTILHVQ